MKKLIFAAYIILVLVFLFIAERKTLPLLNVDWEFVGYNLPIQSKTLAYDLSSLADRSAQSTYLSDFSRGGIYSATGQSFRNFIADWRITDTNNNISSGLQNSPAADESGFYIPDDAGYLRAYSWAGELRWQFYSDLDRGFKSAPLTDEDTIYLGDSAGYFYALNKATGKIRWLLKVGISANSSPILYQNILYFSAKSDPDSSFLLAVNARTGEWIWSSDKVKGEISSPSLSDKLKFIFITSSEGELKAYNLQGHLVWTYDTNLPIECAPLVSADQVVITSKKGKVFSVLAASSIPSWNADLNTLVGCPTTTSKGAVLIGEGVHYFVDLTSGLLAPREGGMPSTASVIVSGNDQYLLFQCQNRSVCVEQVSTGARLQYIQLRSNIVGNPIYFNDRIIFGTQEIDGLFVYTR